MTINIETMGWGGWFLLTLITPFLLLEATPKYWPLGLPLEQLQQPLYPFLDR